MATTKKTAKKTAARKPAAKKTAARKPAAKQVETKKPAFDMPDMDEINERFDDIMTDAMKFVRDATYTSVGVPLVVQERLSKREFTTMPYDEFMDEAKAKGETRVHEIQDRFEPYVQRLTDRIEPVTDRIEARLPEQVKEAIETGRDRVRHVLDA